MAMGPGWSSPHLLVTTCRWHCTYLPQVLPWLLSQLWTVPLMCFLLIVVLRNWQLEWAVLPVKVLHRWFVSALVFAFPSLAMGALLSNIAVTFLRIRRYCVQYGALKNPTYVLVPISALMVWLLTVGGSKFRRIEKIFAGN